MRTFKKPAVSVPDQIALLERRGLVIRDRGLALHALTYISYYRLRAYSFYFELNNSDPGHQLKPGTTLEDVLDLYDFDRRLRLLVNDAVERIEVAARGSWAHHLAMVHGSHGYLDDRNYLHPAQAKKNMAQLAEEVDRSHDTFIQHYRNAYGDPPLPPVWMVAEVISFGLLSKMISTLAARASRQGIARPLGLDERVFTSFMHHLGTVRNVCAHHGRLWNRRWTVTLTMPHQPAELASSVNKSADRQIYNTLVVMGHIMARIAPQSDWMRRVIDLLKVHPTGDLAAMGFPLDWETRSAWMNSRA
jgi:abortive infection bacteriophage resistance protein